MKLADVLFHAAKPTLFPAFSHSYYLREFVRTAVILTPAREASRVGTALCRQDPQDPEDLEDPVECSFFSNLRPLSKLSVRRLEFETPIEVQPSQVSMASMVTNMEEFEEALASSRYAGVCGGGAGPPTGPTGPIGPGGRRPTKRAKVPKGPRRPKADWRANGTNGTLCGRFGNEDGHEIVKVLAIRPETGNVHINFFVRIQPKA